MKIKAKFFLTLALLFTAFSSLVLVSSAEEPTAAVTVTDAASLSSAISDTDAAYIKLGADFTVDEPITVARDGITIDLNGHTITADNSSSYLFKLELENIRFSITGSGSFNISRYLYNTMKSAGYVGAKNASVAINASDVGITFTSPDEYTGHYITVGAQGKHADSLTLTGKINILNPNCTSAIQIYNSSTLNISNSYIKSECDSFLYTNGSKYAVSQISFINTSFYSLGNYIINSMGKYLNLIFDNSYIEYSNSAFKGDSTTDNYFLNLTMTNTDTKFTGTATSEIALLNGKGITAVIDGGFHNLNGASLAIGTNAYSENNGVLIKKGTAISCDFSSYENVMFENENAETAKWFDISGNFIAMGYYTSAEDTKLDTSVLPIVIKDEENYNLKYMSWTGKLKEKVYEFTPDESTMIPIPALKGIKYNLSTYTNFNMNIYVPATKDIIGGYSDSNCSYSKQGENILINNKEYIKFSFAFGASNMDSVTMHVKYNADCEGTIYPLVQEISVSVIDYTETILNGSEFSEIEKRLAADMLRYCNETVKLADGSYNTHANDILEKNSDYLTDINTLELENTDTDTDSLSDYINEAMLLFNAYEPKFAFRYTEKVTSPSTSESDGNTWLSISYISVDGLLKTAKTEIETENKIFYTTGIAAYDIDELLMIKVYEFGSDTPVAEGTFSLATYISTLKSTATDITFAKVLYAYSLSAEAYKKDV